MAAETVKFDISIEGNAAASMQAIADAAFRAHVEGLLVEYMRGRVDAEAARARMSAARRAGSAMTQAELAAAIRDGLAAQTAADLAAGEALAGIVAMAPGIYLAHCERQNDADRAAAHLDTMPPPPVSPCTCIGACDCGLGPVSP